MTIKQISATAATIVTSFGIVLGAATHALAQGVGNSTACMIGSVDALDDASYDEDFGTDQWKNVSGVNLSSDNQRVVLSVFDEYGNSICQNTADLSTTCKFHTGFSSTFTIRVDNTQNASSANYTVCSF